MGSGDGRCPHGCGDGSAPPGLDVPLRTGPGTLGVAGHGVAHEVEQRSAVVAPAGGHSFGSAWAGSPSTSTACSASAHASTSPRHGRSALASLGRRSPQNVALLGRPNACPRTGAFGGSCTAMNEAHVRGRSPHPSTAGLLKHTNCLLYTFNVPVRRRHPKKQVEQALQDAEARGWTVTKRSGRGHAWGVARCSSVCVKWIWSTPADADNHAREIRQAVAACPHQEESNG